jgi:hypothetical protein
MNSTAGGGLGSAPTAKADRGRLEREVLVPVPAYKRASTLIGLSLILVLVASAVDAVVWTYQSQRRIWQEEAAENIRPALKRSRAVEPPRVTVPDGDERPGGCRRTHGLHD